MVAKEKISEDDKNNTIANITTHTDMLVGAEGVGLVVDIIQRLVETLAALSSEMRRQHVEPLGFESILGTTHFTVTQRRQLRRALRRWSVLHPETDPETDPGPWTYRSGARDARAILQHIEAHLDRRAPAFGALR